MDECYINVGSEKCCLFVKMSAFLLGRLRRYPLLYYAVEEALQCAEIGYYGIGIVTFSQLLNLFGRKALRSRHGVAHEVLRHRPTGQMFEGAVEAFKSAASRRSDDEWEKHGRNTEYQERLVRGWEALMSELNRR